jgi:hypothetical protein
MEAMTASPNQMIAAESVLKLCQNGRNSMGSRRTVETRATPYARAIPEKTSGMIRIASGSPGIPATRGQAFHELPTNPQRTASSSTLETVGRRPGGAFQGGRVHRALPAVADG